MGKQGQNDTGSGFHFQQLVKVKIVPFLTARHHNMLIQLDAGREYNLKLKHRKS